MASLADKMRYLCDKFGWDVSDPFGTLDKEIMDHPASIEVFAMHAMCAFQEACEWCVGDVRIICGYNAEVSADDFDKDGMTMRKHDNTPLGLATAIIEAIYQELGGED